MCSEIEPIIWRAQHFEQGQYTQTNRHDDLKPKIPFIEFN